MTELEKLQRAKMYVDKLANGFDPISDVEMSGDTLLNNVRMSRCFFYVSEILGKVIDNGGEVGKKYVVQKLPFTITAEQAEKIMLTEEPVGVAILAKRIAEVLNEDIKPLAAVHISNWCVAQDLLREETVNGKARKVSTEKGNRLGIYTIDSTNMQGVPYKKNVYDKNAQRYIIENLNNIVSND